MKRNFGKLKKKIDIVDEMMMMMMWLMVMMLVKIFPFQQSFHNFDVSFMCSNPVDDNKIMTIVSNGFQWFDNNHIVQRKRLQT